VPVGKGGPRGPATARPSATKPSLFLAIARPDSLAGRVEQELERLIVENRLAPEERLLAERPLADRFGVSRTVVREAVRSLAAKGLLEVRTGDGTYVRNPSHTNAAESLARLFRFTGMSGPDQTHAIYELRQPLEVEIAGLAAERATQKDVEALKRWVDITNSPGTDEATHIDADMQFHLALAEATRNPLFSVLLESMGELMRALREVGVKASGGRREGRVMHSRLLERVVARDAAGARSVMHEHMRHSEEILRAALGRARRQQ
jgi:GntR family transcriptional regulator, transcriptional repressor for pyruvate dehydrogenase complex